MGKKKYPVYRIVLQDQRRDPWGKTNELLGNYNPHTKEFTCKEDRIKYWMSVGAQLSPSINNLLVRKGIITGKKMKSAIHKKKKGAEEEAKSEEKKDEASKEEKPVEEKKEESKTDSPAPEEKPAEEVKEEIKEEKTVEEKKEEEKPAE